MLHTSQVSMGASASELEGAPASTPLPCIAIAGPTASGKTAAALAAAAALARTQAVEIISVDSALIYRGMDIGSAKPSSQERAAVPHHLIDTLDPLESYSAAAFVADTLRLVGGIRARGAMPLLVGGTMLYFKALMQGLDAMPAADPAVRAQIDAQAAQLGWPALHAQLAQVDPVTAERLAPNDSQRIQRALEVWMSSGQPLSSFHRRQEQPQPLLSLRLISLEPDDRAWLHHRVALRFDAMLQQGFLEEVRALRSRGDLHLGLPSMRCVGYRQAWEMFDALDGREPDAHALALLRERGIAATRQLAKRQITWLRSMPERLVIPADAGDALLQTVRAVMAARDALL